MLDICLFGETARSLRVPFSDPFSHHGNCGPGVATTLTVDLTHWVKKAMGSALRPTPCLLSLKGGHGQSRTLGCFNVYKTLHVFPKEKHSIALPFLV